MRISVAFLLLLFFCSSLLKINAQAISDSIHHKPPSWFVPATKAMVFGTATYCVYRYGDASVRTYVQTHRSGWKTTVSGGVSDFGLGRSQAVGLGVVASTAWILNDQRLKKTSIIWLGSLLLNSTITDAFKTNFQRHRPNTGDPYNTFDWRKGNGTNKSFVSAHTSNIFTTATVFSLNYKYTKWVPPVSYGLATLVGLSRIYDNAHWASDVMAGAAVGYMSARLVNFAYNRISPKLQFLPEPAHRKEKTSVAYQF